MQLKLLDKIRNSNVRNSSDRWRHQPKSVATCRVRFSGNILLHSSALRNGDSIYKGDRDVFWQFRGQRRPIGIFHGGTFLTAFKMRSIWCILFLNRIGPSQDIRHSPQKIQEVVPRFRSWKLSPPKFAMIWRGVRYRRKYHQNDRLEKAVKKVPPWKIPIGRLCPRNCQKPSQSPL